MSPFEDPECIDSRFSWHYRHEYQEFYEKYQAKQKYERLKQSILENQETYTLVTPKTPTIFEKIAIFFKQSSFREEPLLNKVWLCIKCVSCYLNAWLLL